MKLTIKMERWLETRLWNKRLNKEPLIIEKIVPELIGHFKIELTVGKRKQLELKIAQIRWRIYKRYERWCHRRDEFAKTLNVPPKLVERWLREGWLDPSKPAEMQGHLSVLLERDDYKRSIKNVEDIEQLQGNPDMRMTVG